MPDATTTSTTPAASDAGALPLPRAVRAPDAALVSSLLALAERARAADDVAPLNEAALLRLRADVPTGDDPVTQSNDSTSAASPSSQVRHLVATAADDTPLGYAQVELTADGAEVEVVVDPDQRRRGVARSLLLAADEIAGDRPLRGWAHGDLPQARALAVDSGMTPQRELLTMALELGADAPQVPQVEGVEIAGFDAERDAEDWLAVNARSFVDHPEQGRWTREDLQQRLQQDWFDPQGLLLLRDAGDGRLLGYHWTKVVDGVGEVYVVGVDPGARGRGLGRLATLAGLAHLHRSGVRHVDLYVESDNTAAVAVYERLGFELTGADVMYGRG